MEVTIRLFAVLAESAGQRQLTVPLPPGATPRSAWQQLTAKVPSLAALDTRLLVAVNQEYAGWDRPLRDGDEVAFIPPLGGGGDEPRPPAGEADRSLFEVTEEPLSLDAVMQKVVNPHAGAVVVFTGTVREFTGRRRTVELEYEAYPGMAVREMTRLAHEVQSRWPGARIAVSHRVGRLAIGEVSVVIAVATPHRRSAFAACEYAIDRLKEIVPIWKKERWEGGEYSVGAQRDPFTAEERKQPPNPGQGSP